jgi:hypothetical protein
MAIDGIPAAKLFERLRAPCVMKQGEANADLLRRLVLKRDEEAFGGRKT